MESSAKTGHEADTGPTQPTTAESEIAPGPEASDTAAAPSDRLADSERAARYRLIAPLARDRRVLDAGCGTAEGCTILAAAGATGVVGVDPEQALLEAVRPRVPPEIELSRAEPSELPQPDSSFDLVVCFAGSGANEGPAAWLDELVRVLAPGGLLVVGADPAAAPGLERALATQLPNVGRVRVSAWTAVALLAERAAAAGDAGALEGEATGAAAELRLATDPTEPGSPAAGFVLLASAAALPPLPQLVALAEPLQRDRLLDEIARQRAEIQAREGRIAELEAAQDEVRELRRLLTEAEQLLAELPELRRRSEELESLTSSAEWRIATALRVPGQRAEGMWLPAVRRRFKQLIGWLVRLVKPS